MNEASPRLLPGDPAPWFVARCTSNEKYHFDSVAGRTVVLCFFGSAGRALSAAVLTEFLAAREIFDDAGAAFFGVSVDPEDERAARVREILPGYRWFWDFDRAASRAYGAVTDDPQKGTLFVPQTFVLDERLRVLAAIPFADDARRHAQAVLSVVRARSAPPATNAPVLVLPRVFEPALCARLVAHYEEHGGKDSGVMRDRNGMTVGEYDHGFKRRRDQTIMDESLRGACIARIRRRLVPEIRRAFAFEATRIERHIVACYDAAEGGFFRAHRDNGGKGTAHRRFAVTLNLNTGEYEGGELRFPEYGRQTYAAEAGGAVVFACGMLHEATPVKRGRRYAYLPFLYDEAAARIREQNRAFVAAEDESGNRMSG
jgi:peroxiredoxin/predicted 2-oxoglutarate/Fe(II)-dependent dioxygenase YbiX